MANQTKFVSILRTNGVNNQNQAVLDLRAGSGVTLTNVDEKVTIASSGGGGTGTVTSVAETVPAEMTISGSPINTAGTLAIGWNSASANRVIASPTSGSGPYTGRILVAADIPNIAESQVTGLTSDLALKAPLASPALTGSPTAPTQSPGDNTTKIATDAFVTAAIAAAPAPVTSVFTRTGAVVAATNDYTEAQISFSDITTNNVSVTKHGYAPKSPNDATKYLDGTGAYSVPAGSGTAPGGSNTQIQYNNSAVFGGVSGATTDGTNLSVTTQTALDNSTKAASTAYVDSAVAAVAPGGSAFAYGGDGSDSSITFDGIINPVAGATLSGSTYTMTRDIWATAITVNSGVTVQTANWRIFCTGTLTNNGNINNDGQTGGTGSTASSATGASGGAGGQLTSGSSSGSFPQIILLTALTGGAGGNGTSTAGAVAATGTNGTQIGDAALPGSGAGAAGTQGGAGGNGIDSGAHGGGAARSATSGGISPSAIAAKPARQPINAIEFGYRNVGTPSQWIAYSNYNSGNGSSVGGSGGGGDGSIAGGGGGGGGGQGGHGGALLICAKTITNGATGVISAQGGTGGVGGTGFSPTTGTGTGGGGAGAGGPGGNGGYVMLVYSSLTNSGTIRYAGGGGGAHGTGGTGHGTGTNGGNGNNGASGKAGALVSIAC